MTEQKLSVEMTVDEVEAEYASNPGVITIAKVPVHGGVDLHIRHTGGRFVLVANELLSDLRAYGIEFSELFPDLFRGAHMCEVAKIS